MGRYLTTDEAAARLHVLPQTMRLWRLRGVGPKFTKPSRSRVLYQEEQIEAFLEARTFGSTAEESEARRRSAAA